VLREKAAAGANLGVKAVHNAHRTHASVQQRLFEVAEQTVGRERHRQLHAEVLEAVRVRADELSVVGAAL